MAHSFTRLLDRWTYEPIALHSGSTPSRGTKSTHYKKLGIFLALGLTGCIIWMVLLWLRRSAYSPLDNYQNINLLPVTAEHGFERTPSARRAVVSSLYSDGFAIALAVVGHSTRSANVSARLLLPYLEGPSKVTQKGLCVVRAVGWEPYPVSRISPPHGGSGIHPRFADQYTKLHIWRLDKMGVDSAVYVDADTVVRRNFEELFDSPFNFAAVPDVYGVGDPRGFSLTFNAGVLVYRPSSAVFEDMREKLETTEFPLKQAEQAFLNQYFGGTCMRLPYIYNANLAIKARSPVLWDRLTDEMCIVHYTALKPFLLEGRSSDVVLSLEETEEAIQQSAEREGGFYRQEVGWWEEAYRRMMLDHGQAIRRCYLEGQISST
ncbi:glycosyltransferase family 8 protein [Mycena vitilis]|nr:glycosyltransferase family 8 protein [Mycena vitilis]